MSTASDNPYYNQSIIIDSIFFYSITMVTPAEKSP